jgi:ankyrin repeat protein
MSKQLEANLLPSTSTNEEILAAAFRAVGSTSTPPVGRGDAPEENLHQENSPTENLFADIATELIIACCDYLLPEDLFAFIDVNHFFHDLLNDNYFWRNKFRLHFPHLFPKYEKEKIDSWYGLFRGIYNASYPNLSEAHRRVFSQIKERRFDDQLIALLHSIATEPKDSQCFTVYDWIVKLAGQAFLDRLFATITEQQIAMTGRTPLHWAVVCNQPLEKIKGLTQNLKVPDKSGDTPLALAIKSDRLDLVKFLWDEEMNLDQRIKNHPRLLALASFTEDEAVAKFLLEKGLSAKEKSELGIPPLFIATQRNHLGLMHLFLANNADVNDSCSSNNATALYIAAENNNYEACELLLNAGANANLACKNGATALHAAVLNGNLKMIQLLLKYGANLRATLIDGEEKLTVFDLADEDPNLRFLLNKALEREKISSSPYILLAPPKLAVSDDTELVEDVTSLSVAL